MAAKRAPSPEPEALPEPITDPGGEVRELTEEDFALFRPTAEMSEAVEALRRAGRPPLPAEARKVRVTMDLDPDLVERLKADGRGWRTRANAALRRGMSGG